MAGLLDLLRPQATNLGGMQDPEVLRGLLAQELKLRGHPNVDLRALNQDQMQFMLRHMRRPAQTVTPGIRG